MNFYILNTEEIEYDKSSLKNLIKITYPDIRNTIITLRKNVVDGRLKKDIEKAGSNKLHEEILNAIKSGDPEQVRKILKSNTVFYPDLYKFLYEELMTEEDVFKKDAEAMLLLCEHCYRDSIVDIKEINFIHMIFKFIETED